MSEQQRWVFTDEFKREAVGMIASSGRTLRQVAGDLGLGLSTLTRWKRQLKDVEIAVTPNPDMTKELARLRKENEVLKQERDFLKKAAVGSIGQRNMIYFMRHPEAHNGKNRSTRFITATEKGTLATLEGWAVAE